MVTYGAILWFGKVDNRMIRRHLLAAQRIVLLILTKACRTVSTAAMQVIGGYLPLDLEVVKKGLESSVRLNRYVKWGDYEFYPIQNIDNLSLQEIKNINNVEYDKIKEVVYKTWQSYWETEVHGRDTYEYIKEVNFAAERKWFKPSKGCTYVITGYGPFKFTLWKRGLEETKFCPKCNTANHTSEHVIFQCSHYDRSSFEDIRRYENCKYRLLQSEEKFSKFQSLCNKVIEDCR
ncbi:hypothetical protein KPH14_012976 [Odynerus spinipes]|uniref:Reverse transcriptase zinc-binding domain-containing protein n=1 Tax=Odynerus spinipes TaxID=1348599 RepID=A0AAD9R874_9HYME|nr:hypothetical protein KPH14_012976 [Odynerus spinipes]